MDRLDLQEFDENVDNTRSQPKQRSPLHTTAPLDLSFKSISSVNDMVEDIGGHEQANLQRSEDTLKYSCSAIRLNNNAIGDLNKFADVMAEVVENIEDIAWLDLSFNDLEVVDQELIKFKSIKALHLHGNNISKLEELNKLTALSQLRTLTMHGNPIDTEKHYRQYVLSLFPNLKSLDFSAVTKQDRTKAEVWSKMRPKGLKKHRTNKKSVK